MPWAQESVDAGLQCVLAEHRRLVAERWEEVFEDLGEDVLGEAVQEARQDGRDPVRTVDVLVRGLVQRLEE
ncbi:hypothetical protein [Kitasatospora sp. NPDC001225]